MEIILTRAIAIPVVAINLIMLMLVILGLRNKTPASNNGICFFSITHSQSRLKNKRSKFWYAELLQHQG